MLDMAKTAQPGVWSPQMWPSAQGRPPNWFLGSEGHGTTITAATRRKSGVAMRMHDAGVAQARECQAHLGCRSACRAQQLAGGVPRQEQRFVQLEQRQRNAEEHLGEWWRRAANVGGQMCLSGGAKEPCAGPRLANVHACTSE